MDPAVPEGLALGSMEEPVDGLEEALCLARGDAREDALATSADHLGKFLHRRDLRARHVAAPAVEQEACTVRLRACEGLAQFRAVLPAEWGWESCSSCRDADRGQCTA